MDKWLWAARFFKTRSLAAKACELGRIDADGQRSKPAREVRVGDMLKVKSDGGDFQVEILALSDIRGPAAIARMLYRETEESRDLRMKLVEARKGMSVDEGVGQGRPSKRDRREIDRFRNKRGRD